MPPARNPPQDVDHAADAQVHDEPPAAAQAVHLVVEGGPRKLLGCGRQGAKGQLGEKPKHTTHHQV